jgi:hypothetical protein
MSNSPFVEIINAGNSVVAIILRSQFSADGIHFFTPNEYSQQLAYMKHKSGHIIEPHIHNPIPREVVYTREVLLIRSGCVRVDLYDEDKKYLISKILNDGDVILLAGGGHGFQIIENAEIIEIKQGPYSGEKDKTRFASINMSQIKIK